MQDQPPSKPEKQPQNKLILAVAALVLIVVVAVVIVVLTTNKNNNKASKVAVAPVAAVRITSQGFSPATISVKPGTQVVWTNTDAAVHQVAADPYPKDNSIPGFNNSVILQGGNSLEFVFKAPGTYTYHDERNPLKLKGTIVVK